MAGERSLPFLFYMHFFVWMLTIKTLFKNKLYQQTFFAAGYKGYARSKYLPIIFSYDEHIDDTVTEGL
jgi:hypothetical protein